MEILFWVVGLFALISAMVWLSCNLINTSTKPLTNINHTIKFPFLVTLSVKRNEIPLLTHTGIYDAVVVQRNPYALEMRLSNTTNTHTIDPFSFYLPLEQTVLREMASLLLTEADRLNKTGDPY